MTKLTITKKSNTKQAAKNREDAARFAARDEAIRARKEAASSFWADFDNGGAAAMHKAMMESR